MDASDEDALAKTAEAGTGLGLEATETAAAPPEIGALLGEGSEVLIRGASIGRYLVVDELGRGGAGVVYSVFDRELDRKVALKVLRKSRDRNARARLLREAQAMAKLSDPNVVTVFEVGTDCGRDFVAMEYVRGQDLAGWGHQDHSIEEIVEIYRQAGRGLAAAHRVGLVHRDFKPHNVLICEEGRVRVTDFGLATTTADSPLLQEIGKSPRPFDSSLTKAGSVMGTPAYMAPEQHLAEPATAQSDQFSFCVALYEALAGQRPYRADNYDALKALVLEKPAPPIPETVRVSAQIRAAVAKGLSRKADSRHESMDALLQQLEPPPRQRSRWLYIGAAAIGVAIIAAGVALGARFTSNSSICQRDGSILKGIWDSSVRKNMRAALGSSGEANAGGVFTTFVSVVDPYASAIIDMRMAICKDSRGAHPQSDELMVLRVNCLQRRKQELAALTSAFSNSGARVANHAVDAAMKLASIQDCADERELLRGVEGPPAAIREDVQILQAKIKQAKLQGEAGNLSAGISSAEAALVSGKTLAYKPLLAEIYEGLGALYTKVDRVGDAEHAYQESILAAEESDYVEYQARSLTGLTLVIASASSRFEEAERYARRARAAIAKWGKGLNLGVVLDLALATLLSRQDHSEEALALLSKTLAGYSVQERRRPIYLIRLQIESASLYIERGDYGPAQILAEKSYAFAREKLGRTNPQTMTALDLLIQTHSILGHREEARRLATELRSLWNSSAGKLRLKEEREGVSSESRNVSGIVVDNDGVAVGGAVVMCGARIEADDRYLDAAVKTASNAHSRNRRVLSTADGIFRCIDVPMQTLAVVAEKQKVGRSAVTQISASPSSAYDVRLRLGVTSSIRGQVLFALHHGVAPELVAIPEGISLATPSFSIVSYIDEFGYFNIQGLAPGKYNLFFYARSNRRNYSEQNLVKKVVVLASGEELTVDFAVDFKSLSRAKLLVSASGKFGAPMPSTEFLILSGHVASSSVEKFNASVLSPGRDDVRVVFWT